MTTDQRKTQSTTTPTPTIPTDYLDATTQEEPIKPCSSSVEVEVPLLINTVFAKPDESRQVIVNPVRIEASLKSLERNRKLKRLGLG